MDLPASRMPIVIDDVLLARFWSKVKRYDADGVCWPWTGASQGTGYGAFKLNGVKIDAHVLAWRLSNGGAPVPVGMELLHSCDVRSCVRPEHLSVGTRSENVKDAFLKQRTRPPGNQGSAHPRAKLTEEIVCVIRRLQRDGIKRSAIMREIGARFGATVSVRTIDKVLTGESWAHVN